MLSHAGLVWMRSRSSRVPALEHRAQALGCYPDGPTIADYSLKKTGDIIIPTHSHRLRKSEQSELQPQALHEQDNRMETTCGAVYLIRVCEFAAHYMSFTGRGGERERETDRHFDFDALCSPSYSEHSPAGAWLCHNGY